MATIKNIFLVTLLFSFGIELYAERPSSDQADEDKFGNKHDWCAEVNYDHTLIIVDTTEKFNENQYELLQNQILNNSSIVKKTSKLWYFQFPSLVSRWVVALKVNWLREHTESWD